VAASGHHLGVQACVARRPRRGLERPERVGQSRALAITHVDPESAEVGRAGFPSLDHGALVPPQAWAHGGHAPEGVRMLLGSGQRDDSAQAAAHDRGGLASRLRAVVRVDERLQLPNDPLQVASAIASTTLRLVVTALLLKVLVGRVVGHALGRVPDAHDDHGWHRTAADRLGRHLVGMPLPTQECGGRVKGVLAIVHVEHGVSAQGVLGQRVAGRKPHRHVAREQAVPGA